MTEPKIGDWATFCCEEDLFQIATPEELQDVADPENHYRYWPTEEAALADLNKKYEPPELQIPEDLVRRLLEIASS